MKLYPGDWLTNAALLGFIRLQNLNGKQYDISQNYIEIKPDDLDGFEQVYFNYAFMELFPNLLKLETIRKLNKYLLKENYAGLVANINEIIEVFKNKLNPIWYDFSETINTHTKIIKDLGKNIKNTVIDYARNNEKLTNKMGNIIEELDKEIEGLCNKLADKKYNYIYVMLQRFFFNKAIIGNPGMRGNNRNITFKEIYVQPAKDLLINPINEGITCKFCSENKVDILKLSEINNFFGEVMFSPIGVSIEKFQNFFYNLQPDLVMCDVCELILLCSWAGFTKIPWKFRDSVNDTEYIFVNIPHLELLVEENEKLKSLYAESELDLKGTIYEEIIYDIFVKEKEKKSKWVLQNTIFIEIKPVVRKDQGKPKFKYFHIGKDIAQMFIDSSAIKTMREIMGKIYLRRDDKNPNKSVFVYAKRETIIRILYRDSLYPLCYFSIKDHLENPNHINIQNAFYLSLLSAIRTNIWYSNKKGEIAMESKQVYGILKSFSDAGENLAKGIDYDKRKRISYRLLSLIRIGKITDFYEVLMKLYISQNKPIEEIILSILNNIDVIQPEAKAYAFMSGFLSQQQEKSLTENTSNE